MIIMNKKKNKKQLWDKGDRIGLSIDLSKKQNLKTLIIEQ